MLATVYGVTSDGSVRNIKTGTAVEVRQIWKTKNPEQFARIGYFTQGGANRSRKVLKDVSVQPKSAG